MSGTTRLRVGPCFIEGIVHVLSGLEGPTVLSLGTSLAQAGQEGDVRADLNEGTDGDLFALQDRISTDVAVTIAPRVRELGRARRKPPANLTAQDLVLQALDRMHRLERLVVDVSGDGPDASFDVETGDDGLRAPLARLSAMGATVNALAIGLTAPGVLLAKILRELSRRFSPAAPRPDG